MAWTSPTRSVAAKVTRHTHLLVRVGREDEDDGTKVAMIDIGVQNPRITYGTIKFLGYSFSKLDTRAEMK